MLFNSLTFILFLPIVYILYRVLPRTWRRTVLLVASWVFYGFWDLRFLALLIAMTGVDYTIGRALEDGPARKRRLLVGISVAVNLSVLGAFKYMGFFILQAKAALSTFGVLPPPDFVFFELVLPVGMSFYVFQSMAYVVDIYRGQTKAVRSYSLFALFIAWFPQLVAGPIGRSKSLMPQLEALPDATTEQRARGAQLILWGFFKKVVVADNLAIVVQNIFDRPEMNSGFMVLIGAYAFTWQIYCDFSGYCDIGRGVSRWFGVELAENFRRPFFATSPRDLWRRWHITLSTWLRDYLYIPLGGSRRGTLRTLLNLIVTMVLGGMWHGANWTFLVWGKFHGVALVVQRVLPAVRLGRIGKILAIVATFHITVFGFLIFRAHDMGQVQLMVRALAQSHWPGADELLALRLVALLVLPVWIFELVQHLGDESGVNIRWPAVVQALAAALILLSIVVLGASYGRQFIYFQF